MKSRTTPARKSPPTSATSGHRTVNVPPATLSLHTLANAEADELEEDYAHDQIEVEVDVEADGDRNGGEPATPRRDSGGQTDVVKKANHKEVERKRRQTIAKGIEELAAILPDTGDKAKGKVLQLAVKYIGDLKRDREEVVREREGTVERMELERQMLEQTVNALTLQLDNQRVELDDLRLRNEMLSDELALYRQELARVTGTPVEDIYDMVEGEAGNEGGMQGGMGGMGVEHMGVHGQGVGTVHVGVDVDVDGDDGDDGDGGAQGEEIEYALGSGYEDGEHEQGGMRGEDGEPSRKRQRGE